MTVPPGNLKAFGTKERPVILDISQLIERVNWVLSKDILLLRIDAKVRTPHIPTANIIVSDGVYTGDAFVNVINEHDAKTPFPAISLPKISKEMFRQTIEWNKTPPLKRSAVFETFNDYTQLIFFNLRRLKTFNDFKDASYQIKVTFPGSTRRTITGTTYWIYYDPFGNPFEYYRAHPSKSGIIIDAEGHTAVVSFPTVFFGGLARRNEILGFNEGSLPPLRTFDEPTSTVENDLFQWKIEAWTFRGREEFPVNLTDYTLAFDTNDAKNKGYKTDHAGSNVDELTPSFTVTITVNFKTLALELTKA